MFVKSEVRIRFSVSREACVRNLEALLCRQVRADIDETKTIKALFYFQSVQNLPLKPDVADTNIVNKIYNTLIDSTRDAFAVLGVLVIFSALNNANVVADCYLNKYPSIVNKSVLSSPQHFRK